MSDANASVVTERMIFSGRVQGVGFRATTRGIARRFPVAGYVRNLPDGTVELVVRGSESAINDVLKGIVERFERNLSKVDRNRIDSKETFSCFEIRY
jgi:acylphosphatase